MIPGWSRFGRRGDGGILDTVTAGNFKKNKAIRLFWAIKILWVILIRLMTAGMITGLHMI